MSSSFTNNNNINNNINNQDDYDTTSTTPLTTAVEGDDDYHNYNNTNTNTNHHQHPASNDGKDHSCDPPPLHESEHKFIQTEPQTETEAQTHVHDIDLSKYSKYGSLFFYNRFIKYFYEVEDYSSSSSDVNNNGSSPSLSAALETSNKKQEQEQSFKLKQRRKKSSMWVNQNVVLMLLISLGVGAVRSIWEGTITSAYLTQREELDDSEDSVDGDTNDLIAYIISSDGLVGVIIAFPLGHYLDKHEDKRAHVIRLVARIIFVVTIGLIIATSVIQLEENSNQRGTNAAEDDETSSTLWLYIVEELVWTLMRECMEGPGLVLYITSVPASERRVKAIVAVYASMQAFAWVGPLVSIALYEVDGNHWTREHMRTVMLVALCMTAVLTRFMLHFDDQKALYRDIRPSTLVRSSSLIRLEDCDNDLYLEDEDEDERSVNNTSDNEGYALIMSSSSNDEDEVVGMQLTSEQSLKQSNSPTNGASNVNGSDHMINVPAYPWWLLWHPINKDRIAGIIIVCTALFGFSTGMTYDFMTRFIEGHTDLSNGEAQIFFLIIPFVNIVSFFGALRTTRQHGRMSVILCVKVIGTALTFGIAVYLHFESSDMSKNVYLPLEFIKLIFLRCTIPIETSILVDFLSGRRLGLFLALFGVFEFSWNGAALVGESIEDATSYAFLYMVAGIIYTLSVLMYLPLYYIVPM